MESPDFEFDAEIFESEFQTLISEWKDTWVSPGAGPLVLAKHLKDAGAFSEEALLAEKPCEEALERILEYVATASLVARRAGKFDELMRKLENRITFSFKGGQDRIRVELYRDIFKRTVGTFPISGTEAPEKEGGDILAIVGAARKSIGREVSFGIKH
jgi:hypothetical protein